jgi:hypothetical protein
MIATTFDEFIGLLVEARSQAKLTGGYVCLVDDEQRRWVVIGEADYDPSSMLLVVEPDGSLHMVDNSEAGNMREEDPWRR